MKKTLTLILLYSVFITFISPFTTARASSDKFQSKLSTAGSSNRSINKSSNQANSQTSDSEDDSGLVYKLSEQNTRPPEPAGKPQIEMLDPGRTEQLVSLLPDIGSEGELQSDFKLSNATIPPPKTGERLPIINPGEMISPPDVNTNTKLEIVRFAPSGEVGKAAELTVTFSDPMVSITSQDQALENIPVELSPKVEGGWRWLGTKTLLFAAKPRFPMATEYTLRIPAGTRSANGAILDKDFVWNFTTPPVGIENKYPTGEGIKLDPVILIKFDQAISQTALLPYIKIIANGKEIPFRLAADDEIMADEETKGLVNSYKESSQQSTYIAIRPIDQSGNTADALPKNSLVTVRLLAGAPSQEGPLTTKTVQEFSFKTYKDFQFEELNCRKNQDGTCSPESGVQLIFSNPLALQEFKPEYVKIEPSVEEVNIHASGSVINLNGPFQGKTRYKVTVDGRLKDDFGQQLGKEITAEFITGNLQPGLYDTGEVFQVLDPFYPPKVSFYSVNIPVFRVRIYRVRPVDYPSFLDVVKKVFQQSQQKKNSKEKEEIAFPGKLVSDLKISSDQADNKYIREDIELSKFLDNNRGHLLVYVEPVFEDSLPSEYPNQTFPQIAPILKWVQATQIGLSALSDYEQLSIYASDIKTGKALADVQIELYPKAGLSALAYPADKSISLNQTLFEKINWMFGPQAADPIESYFLNRQDSKRNTDKEFPSTTENSEKLEKGQHTESGWERESEDIYSFAAATGRDGMAKLALPERAGGNEKGNFNYLVASLGNDTAILTRESSYRGVNPDSGWFKTPQNDELRWYVFDDRGIYKPGEEAAIKGYIRIWQAGKYGDIKALDGSFRQIKWQFVDDDGNELLKGTTAINNYGGFDLKFRLPQGINLDTYRLVLSVENQIANNQFEHNIRVDEFRRPDFEVKTALQTAGPVIVGNEVTLSADAKYFSGGALPNAPVNWQTSARVTDYNPPGHDGYHFGRWSWWFSYYDEEDNFSSEGEFTSKTDKQGRHLLNVAFNDAEPAFAYNFYAAVTVSDVNRQTYGSGTSFIVHPAELYVGLKSSKSFVSKGEKFTVQSIATDIDGKLAEGRKVKLTAELLENKYIDGEWQETVTDTQNCEVTSAVSPQNCTFEARRPGSYKVTASILDDRERLSQTEIRVIVTGGGNWFRQDSSGERLTLVPDKESYAPGETARILINSPFENAEGTLTISRGGILTSQHIVVSGGSAELPVKIEEKFIPEVKLFVNLYSTEPRDVNAAPEQSEPAKPKPRPISPAKSSNSKKSQSPAGRQNENLPPKPAMVSNEITLGVSTASRTLSVEILPEKTFTEPGAETQISFMVKDSVGRPVPQAEVALVVADEAIMSLVNYNVPSPIEAFYKALDSSLEREESRNYVNLASSNPVFVKSTYYKYGFLYRAVLDSTTSNLVEIVTAEGYGDGNGEGFGAGAKFSLRKNFNPLALFSASNLTDKEGKGVVRFKLPDNLTRYRITAVATDGAKSFGKGQANLTTKKELMVKPSPPRFLNVGDRFELPIVIENQGEKDVPTELAVRWLNAKYEKAQVNNPSAPENNSAEPFNQQSEHFTGRKVIVPAGNRVEVRIPLKTEKAGSFRFQSLAVAGGFNDAAQVEVPVLTPATTEAFATYGNTDKNSPIIQPISIPQNVYPQFGGLEITASSTQLQELTDAFISLAEYKFDCTEQIASRVLSIAALADVLYAFKSGKMPDRATLESYVNRDIEKMLSRQRDDGSFGLWSKEGESYNFPFVSVHAAHALAIAKQKGFKVPDAAIKASLDYLENINETTDEIYKNLPEISLTIRAYALYVRSLLGDADLAEIEHLIKSTAIEKMPFEAIGWILSTSSDNRLKDNPVAVNLRQQIIRFLQNRSTETAATAHFVTDYKDNGWTIMASSRRADAILLDALLRAVPQNDLIPKLVRGLLDNRKKGEWANTQENVFVLLAMDRYFGTFEKQTPEFLLRIWLGDKLIGEKNFSGRSADSGVMMVPMSQLINAKDQTLLMSKNGPGRLYYRIGLNYAPKNLKLPAVDYGFTVIRSYQAVDDPADVQKLSDGTWQIKAGARVRVRLVLTAPSRRYHVALVDNLPAGFEILNPELLNTASQGRDESDRQQNGWWAWFDHQNLRDDRAEVFTSLLYGDTYEYTFLARATTPGEFIAPPAKAEEMYHPETFGRSATETVIIK